MDKCWAEVSAIQAVSQMLPLIMSAWHVDFSLFADVVRVLMRKAILSPGCCMVPVCGF